MKHSVSLGLLLFGVYLLWSGLSFPWDEHFHLLLFVMGIVSTLLVLYVTRRMGIVDAEGAPLSLISGRALLYVPWLLWEIAKANLDVARRILHPALPISPCLIEVRASQSSEFGQVIYANSITLTPGTVSVLVDNGTITVHALSEEAAAGVQSGEMDRKVASLEGRG